MSYSASDFVEACQINADAFGLPLVDPMDADMDYSENDESDALQTLAERVARGMDDRAKLLEALRRCVKEGDLPLGVDAEARHAIALAEGRTDG